MCMYKCKICGESYYRDEVSILDCNMLPVIEEDQIDSNNYNMIICHSCEDNNDF